MLINQAAALAGDITSGDAPGFPVEIHEPGLYRLVGNLDTRGQPTPWDLNAVEIKSEGVTLDLNGFQIRGPTSCNVDTLVCAPVATDVKLGNGVLVAPSDAAELVAFSGTRIINGLIRGMPTAGILCAVSCRISDVNINNSGVNGLFAWEGSIVEHVIAEYNGGAGIAANGTIRNVTARFNLDYGIFASGPTLVEGAVASDNLGDGIFANPGTSLVNNLSTRNQGDGFRCAGCTMTDNHASRNEGYG
ncbi:MAG TPA: right-handed parallel beta-helix repeat-containing protein, partial [Wenzhouxiangella sp.]|nr:right-handed parallel beta-helix repeat-containing protein [Wenzhouxiangella sp.]